MRHLADLEAHIRRHNPKDRSFAVLDPDDMAKGSIMGWPIIDPHSGKAEYALTLRSAEPEVFGKAFKKKYGNLVEMFATRIQLEHALIVIQSATKKP